VLTRFESLKASSLTFLALGRSLPSCLRCPVPPRSPSLPLSRTVLEAPTSLLKPCGEFPLNSYRFWARDFLFFLFSWLSDVCSMLLLEAKFLLSYFDPRLRRDHLNPVVVHSCLQGISVISSLIRFVHCLSLFCRLTFPIGGNGMFTVILPCFISSRDRASCFPDGVILGSQHWLFLLWPAWSFRLFLYVTFPMRPCCRRPSQLVFPPLNLDESLNRSLPGERPGVAFKNPFTDPKFWPFCCSFSPLLPYLIPQECGLLFSFLVLTLTHPSFPYLSPLKRFLLTL